MVNVTHDGDDRRTRFQIFSFVLNLLNRLFNVSIRHTLYTVAELFDDQFCGIGVDRLVLCRHDAVLHQSFHNISHTFGHTVRKFCNGDRFRKLDVTHDFLALHLSTHRFLTGFLLLTLHRCHRAVTTVTTCQRIIQRQLTRAAAAITRRHFGFRVFRVITGVVTLTINLARAGAHGTTRAVILTTCRRSSGSRCRRSSGSFLYFSSTCGFFSFTLFALFFFRLRTERFFALALFAFFCFDFGTTTITLFFACFVFGLTPCGIFGFAGFRYRECLHTAFQFGIRNTGWTLGGVTYSWSCSAAWFGCTWFGNHNAFALGLNHDVLGASVAEALLHISRTATQTKRFFSVVIAHLATFSFPVAELPPSVIRMLFSFAASSTTRSLSPP